MPILQLTFGSPGLDDIVPRTVRMVTTDDDEKIMEIGYLNESNLQGKTIFPTDIFQTIYSFNTKTKSGEYAEFRPILNRNGSIQLEADYTDGNVLLPVTSGNLCVFNGSTGRIGDYSYRPSTPFDYYVVMADNATPIEYGKSVFLDSGGSAYATSISGPTSPISNKIVSLTPTVTTYDNFIPNFTDTNGTIGQTLSARLLISKTPPWEGGSVSHNFNIPGLNDFSSGGCVIYSSTNNVYIDKVTTTTDILDVHFSADPGANTVVSYCYSVNVLEP